jgi:protein involved in polysaccharide export with SLBB domain
VVGLLPRILFGVVLAGPPTGVQVQTQRQTTPLTPPEAAYIVGAGDVLEVSVLDQPDASRSTAVQHNGRFTMPLLGDVEVAGKTVSEIQRLITELLSKDFLVNPHVEVRVREFGSQFVLVLGEVANPGRRPLRTNPRLVDVLIEAGGFRTTASGEIFIQRTGGGTFANGEKTMRFRLNNSAGMTDADRLNFELVLKNGDVVTAVSK